MRDALKKMFMSPYILMSHLLLKLCVVLQRLSLWKTTSWCILCYKNLLRLLFLRTGIITDHANAALWYLSQLTVTLVSVDNEVGIIKITTSEDFLKTKH